MKKLLPLLFAALVFVTASAQAADTPKFTYDPAHTQVMFSVSHLGFSFSHGRFTKFMGGFSFDENQPEQSAADMTIETGSLVMDSAEWEQHLKGADFFNTEKFPTMTFKTTKVEKTGDKTAKVTGDFTLLGVTKPITLDVTFNNAGIHPYSKSYVAGFSATGTIKRSDFGMSYGLPGVGDDVSLNIQVEGTRQDFEKLKK
jgi:polyisoprenoid-binding protein YceI